MRGTLRIAVLGLFLMLAGCGGGGGGAGGSSGVAYFVNFGAGSLYRADLGSGGVVPVAAGFNSPAYVALSPDGTKLYVTDQGSNSLREVTVASGQVRILGSASYAEPAGIAVASDGTLYLLDSSARTLRAVDPATGVTQSIASNLSNTGALALEPGMTTALVTQLPNIFGAGRISRVNLSTGATSVVANLQTNGWPTGLAVSASGEFALAAVENTALIRVNLQSGVSQAIVVPSGFAEIFDVVLEAGDTHALISGRTIASQATGTIAAISRVNLSTGDVTIVAADPLGIAGLYVRGLAYQP